MPRTPGLAAARALLALVLPVLLVAGVAAPASAQDAAGPAPSTTTAPTTEPLDAVDTLARLTQLDAEASALADEVDASLADLQQRRDALAAASTTAEAASLEASVARVEATLVRARVDDLVAAGYAGARTSRLSSVLVAQSPQELLDRMTVLDVLGADSAIALRAATGAREAADAAETGATAARDEAAAAQAQAQSTQDALVVRRDELAARTAEATSLLAVLSASADLDAGSAETLATSRVADQVRASRAGGVRSALVVRPAVGRFTSGYGNRGGSPHNGIDIANTIGTPIVSAADGVVVASGPASGFGLWVRVQHGDGTITTYGHNNTNTVRVGQVVLAGQQIATIGNRGQSTGPHLHFEVELPGGSTVDPRGWLAQRGITV